AGTPSADPVTVPPERFSVSRETLSIVTDPAHEQHPPLRRRAAFHVKPSRGNKNGPPLRGGPFRPTKLLLHKQLPWCALGTHRSSRRARAVPGCPTPSGERLPDASGSRP